MDKDFTTVKDDILADAIATAIKNEKEIIKLTRINYVLMAIIFILMLLMYI